MFCKEEIFASSGLFNRALNRSLQRLPRRLPHIIPPASAIDSGSSLHPRHSTMPSGLPTSPPTQPTLAADAAYVSQGRVPPLTSPQTSGSTSTQEATSSHLRALRADVEAAYARLRPFRIIQGAEEQPPRQNQPAKQ